MNIQKQKICLPFLKKILPFEDDAADYLNHIKIGLTRGILLSDEYSITWLKEFQKYLLLYGLHFSKDDHIYFINLLYDFCFIESLDLRIVIETAKTLALILW